jgi:hypothetical protein
MVEKKINMGWKKSVFFLRDGKKVVFPKGWKKINKGWKKMGAIQIYVNMYSKLIYII